MGHRDHAENHDYRGTHGYQTLSHVHFSPDILDLLHINLRRTGVL
eukprot:CAMPEP_0184474538 /NCGR_PEP_ID=MMETSP0740-20130409/135960_1 /TAXON_ID=385413 /ORGANISM="Thalassiosira miniscula, Strain CCMP1093" /LENGTH=44 /DNA_ID= /DNA_START= /DNA_END= /DNA_ORIENTATION=